MTRALAFVPEFLARLRPRTDAGPIDSVVEFYRFVSTRSAFVAQKTLYGYVKTRMGTRYPRMFEDDLFIASIDIAKMHVFAACLSDLTIFAVSRARQSGLDDATCLELAERCFDAGLADNYDQARRVEAFSAIDAKTAFKRRLAFVEWDAGADSAALFSASPVALFEWAPIAPDLKRHDREIVVNSIRFAWRDVRAQFDKRFDGPALVADVTGRQSAGGG